MAKIIEKPNGERILVGDDTPEDLIYDEDLVKPMDLSNAAKQIKNNLLDPITALISFKEEEYPILPIQIGEYKVEENQIKLKGLLLTTDFAWLLSKKDSLISKIELSFPDRRFLLVENVEIKKIKGKDMNMVTTTINLFLAKHI